MVLTSILWLNDLKVLVAATVYGRQHRVFRSDFILRCVDLAGRAIILLIDILAPELDHQGIDFLLIKLNSLGDRLWQVGKIDDHTSYVRRVLLEPRVSVVANNVILSSFVGIWDVAKLVLIERIGQDVVVVN